MPNHIHIDHRVLYSFMVITTVMNAVIFFIPWKEIMAGKNDFPVFYSSAQMVHEGQASDLYDFDAENRFVHRVSDVTRAPNNHLPYELLIFVPLTFLPFGAAHILWTLISLAMLAAVAAMLHNVRPSSSSFSVTFLTITAFFPVWYCLLQGQDSIMLLFLFALSYWCWKRGQEDAAGFVLALGLFRPQLVLPFAFVTLLGGKWKFVRGFVPGAILVLIASTWVVGLHGMSQYGKILISQGTQGSASALAEQWQVHPSLMPTLRGLLWMGSPSWMPAGIGNFLLISGTLAGLLWAGKRMRGAEDAVTLDLAFASAVATIILVSFHSFLHDFSLMILPLLIVANVVAAFGDLMKRAAYSIVTLGFLLFLSPLYLVLLVTSKVGLLILPSTTALWLASHWRTERLLRSPVRGHQEPISQTAV
jgi:Glycosyltransferase family 87